MSRNARVLGALLTPVVTVPVAAQAAHAYDPPAPPKNPNLPRELDIASPYLPQTVCDPAAKPGVTAFARLMSQHYSEFSYGISRACNYGLTEHSEGRALDWMLNKNDPTEHAIADAVVDWLVAPDANGQPGAMARRFGIMYIIWDRRIWGTYQMNEGWRPYYGSSPHTDHIHFSFSWDGAMRRTSWWTGKAWTSVTRTPGGSASVPVTPSTPDSYPTLQVGASGSDVALAQKVIGTPADGAFGPATETALRTWQRSNSVTVSGVLDAATWARMVSLGKVPPRGTASGLARYGKQTLRQGSSGAAVTALQKELKVTADGAFGPQTEAAVRTFQKSKGLKVDGVVSANVWKALAGLSYTKTGTTTTPAKETVFSRYGKQTLRQGSSGAAVTALQKELKVTADGAFGPQTEAAVRTFQKSKGLKVDGVVSANVWKALAGLSYTKTGTTTTPSTGTPFAPYKSTVLAAGARGTAVKAVQRALGGLAVDGVYGPATAQAVKAFQTREKLRATGIVDGKTWDALERKQNPLLPYRSSVLKVGSRGAAVTALQRALGITADGVYGSQTQAAVKAFQKRVKLTQTGIVTSVTWDALGRQR